MAFLLLFVIATSLLPFSSACSPNLLSSCITSVYNGSSATVQCQLSNGQNVNITGCGSSCIGNVVNNCVTTNYNIASSQMTCTYSNGNTFVYNGCLNNILTNVSSNTICSPISACVTSVYNASSATVQCKLSNGNDVNISGCGSSCINSTLNNCVTVNYNITSSQMTCTYSNGNTFVYNGCLSDLYGMSNVPPPPPSKGSATPSPPPSPPPSGGNITPVLVDPSGCNNASNPYLSNVTALTGVIGMGPPSLTYCSGAMQAAYSCYTSYRVGNSAIYQSSDPVAYSSVGYVVGGSCNTALMNNVLNTCGCSNTVAFSRAVVFLGNLQNQIPGSIGCYNVTTAGVPLTYSSGFSMTPGGGPFPQINMTLYSGGIRVYTATFAKTAAYTNPYNRGPPGQTATITYSTLQGVTKVMMQSINTVQFCYLYDGNGVIQGYDEMTTIAQLPT